MCTPSPPFPRSFRALEFGMKRKLGSKSDPYRAALAGLLVVRTASRALCEGRRLLHMAVNHTPPPWASLRAPRAPPS